MMNARVLDVIDGPGAAKDPRIKIDRVIVALDSERFGAWDGQVAVDVVIRARDYINAPIYGS